VAADGSVELTVRYAFDLSEDARAEAFEELRTNDTAREAFRQTFQERMELVANDTAASVDRDVTVDEATVDVETVDSTGVVELSVTVANLAAVDGDRVTLTEPFASNFQPDREFRVVLPDGHEVVSASPEPTGTADGEVYWAAGTSLDGLELLTEPAEPGADGSNDGGDGDGDTATTPGGDTPGFGLPAALAAFVGLAARRRL